LCSAFEDQAVWVRGADFIFVVLVLLIVLVVVFVFLIVVFFFVVDVVVFFELLVAVLFVIGISHDGEVLAGGTGGGIAVDELRIGFEVGGGILMNEVTKISGAVGCRHRILVGHLEGSPWAAALPARWMQVAGKRNGPGYFLLCKRPELGLSRPGSEQTDGEEADQGNDQRGKNRIPLCNRYGQVLADKGLIPKDSHESSRGYAADRACGGCATPEECGEDDRREGGRVDSVGVERLLEHRLDADRLP